MSVQEDGSTNAAARLMGKRSALTTDTVADLLESVAFGAYGESVLKDGDLNKENAAQHGLALWQWARALHLGLMGGSDDMVESGTEFNEAADGLNKLLGKDEDAIRLLRTLRDAYSNHHDATVCWAYATGVHDTQSVTAPENTGVTLTETETARYLDCDLAGVSRLRNEHGLPMERRYNEWVIHLDALEAWIIERAVAVMTKDPRAHDVQ